MSGDVGIERAGDIGAMCKKTRTGKLATIGKEGQGIIAFGRFEPLSDEKRTRRGNLEAVGHSRCFVCLMLETRNETKTKRSIR